MESEAEKRKERGKEKVEIIEKNEKSKEPTMRGKRKKKEEKRKESLLVGPREVRRVLLLEEFQDVFPKDISYRFPSLRGIEHHVDLTLGATLPNRAIYRMDLEEAKEIQKTSC
ncbi:hypothetical protein CR513_19485, partial [Mucuna pruriens]